MVLKFITASLFISLFCVQSTWAEISVNVDMVRLHPSHMADACNDGDLRVDTDDSFKLKICVSNAWTAFFSGSAMSNPMTTNGDMIYQAAGVPARLAIGTSDQVIVTNGSAPSWSKIVNANIDSAAAISLSKLATLTVSRVLASDSSGVITASSVTTTTLGYLDATSSIQTQLDSKVPATRTISTTAPLTGGGDLSANRTIAIPVATSLADGYLSATDWSTFNSKQAAGNYITALTGDVTASGPGSAAATLATVNANVGSFGSSTSIPSFTVNGKGLITAASGNVVVAPAGTLTGTTLASNVVTSSITSVGTITSGVWNGTAITVANGGTGRTSLTNHGVLVGATTSAITQLAAGSAGQALLSGGASADPAYSTPTYPSASGTSGKVLVSDGTNNVYSTPTFPNASATSGKLIVSDGTNWIASTPTYPNSSATSGKIIVSDGTNFIASTPTFPNSSATSGKIIISDGTNWIASTPTYPNSSATSGKIVVSDGTNFIASTPTYPNASATAGKIIRSDGTNFAASTATFPDTATTSDILYASGTNVWSVLAKTNTAALITNSSGAPAWTGGGTANRLLRTDGTTISFAQAAISTDISGLGTNVATFLGTPSSANLAAALTDETGSGVAVFGTTPTFTTSIIDPLVIGGTGTTSTLTLQTTSGVGTTNADMIFKVGNNGGTEAMRILNSGFVGVGTTAPIYRLHVKNDSSTAYANAAPASTDATEGFNNAANHVAGGVQTGMQFFLNGDSQNRIAYIGAVTESAANRNASLVFTTDDAGSRTEKMRITGAGNVGIGTTGPNYMLEVIGLIGSELGSSGNQGGTGAVYSYSLLSTVNNAAGSGDTTAGSHTISGGTLAANGDYIKGHISVFYANTPSNNKRVRLLFGATTFFDTTLNTYFNFSDNIEFYIARTGAATQRITTDSRNFQSGYATAAETLSGNVTLKAIINGASANDTQVRLWLENWNPGN